MRKSIIITGPRCSCKTLTAKEIAKEFKEDEVCWIYAWQKHSLLVDIFLFRHVNPETSIVIVDELRTMEQVEEIYSFALEGIRVERPMKEPFNLCPPFVAVCSDELNPADFKSISKSFFDKFRLVVK